MMIRSSTMPWIPHNFDPETANTFLRSHIGQHRLCHETSYDCFTAPRNRQNRAGRVRLRGCKSNWAPMKVHIFVRVVRMRLVVVRERRGRKEGRGLFSRSLKLVIRTDGHHWNPLTASPFIPNGDQTMSVGRSLTS